MAAMSDSSQSPAHARAVPQAVAVWIEQIQDARHTRQGLRIQGGGTKSFLVPAAHSPLPVLDTRTHAGIVAYEPTELVITARAGTALTDIESALAAHGQTLAFEPPHFGDHATVGGAVATGLSGPARASVGALRDFVLGVHLVNGRGEYLEFGGQVMKNVAGYDVSRLMAGSLGSLGVIAQVSLKVLPASPAEATLRFDLSQADALEHLARWRGQPLPLNASLWLFDTRHGSAGGALYLRLRGAVAAVEAACARLLREQPGERLAPALAADIWQGCREQTLAFFACPPDAESGLWRLSVAPTAPAWDLAWPTVVEWHGAQRWLWAPLTAAASLRQLAAQAGGHATLFRPPVQHPAAPDRYTPPAAPVLAIHQRLKAAFDPDQVFPPGPWAHAH